MNYNEKKKFISNKLLKHKFTSLPDYLQHILYLLDDRRYEFKKFNFTSIRYKKKF